MHETMSNVEVRYTMPGEPWQVGVPNEDVAELLRPFDGRRRAFLAKLLNGHSKTQAARATGVSVRATQLWAAKDERFADAVRQCEEMGFGSVVEAELYQRAMGGRSDPGSMRALELILRSRREEYRP